MAKRKWNKEHQEWRKKVIDRDKMCAICHKEGKYLNAHHIIPQNFKEWQYETDNGLTLCAGCHTLGEFSAHKHPLWFVDWFITNRPELYNIAMERMFL